MANKSVTFAQALEDVGTKGIKAYLTVSFWSVFAFLFISVLIMFSFNFTFARQTKTGDDLKNTFANAERDQDAMMRKAERDLDSTLNPPQ